MSARATGYRSGLDVLLARPPAFLRRARIGLLSHPAGVTAAGQPAAEALCAAGFQLNALFGPEHGYWGLGGAGERLADEAHPTLGVPIYSLYGARRRPTPEQLEGLDWLIFDLQDLGVRCYTFLATLRYTLESAAAAGVGVLVTERPVPQPGMCDGPCPAPGVENFLAPADVPLAHGMTPAVAARWLVARYRIPVELRLARQRHPPPAGVWPADGPPWIPPSPGIRTWESAVAYASTVWSEAFPQVDVNRTGPLPFRVVGTSGVRGADLVAALNAHGLPGVSFHLHRWRGADGAPREGARLAVIAPSAFHPVRTGVTMLDTLQQALGTNALWRAPGARPEFFDRLFGGPSVRRALQTGRRAEDIARAWTRDLAAFRRRVDES